MDKKQSLTSSLDDSTKNIKDYLENIIALLPGHIFWKDLNCRFLGCNDLQAKTAGLASRHEIVGKCAYDVISKNQPETDRLAQAEAIDRIDRKIMQTGIPLTIEEPLILDDGSQRIFLSQKIPLRDKNSNIIGLLGIALDITERKKIENSLKESFQIAGEVANQAKSEFIRNMEHQLRTPFSGVYCLVEALFNTETDPEKKELLEITYHSAKEFLDLLNAIIDFSRNPMESNAILEKKFNLKNILDSVVTMEKAAAVFKNLTINYIYPNDIPTIFIGDSLRIHRLVLNLFSNAIKFTEKGSVSLQVKLAKQINKKKLILQIIISDTGIGIAKEKQQYIYEKFYRLHPANQNKYTGAGLGLYLVKEIIHDLKGEIDIKSYVDQGSTFTCTIPFKRPLLDEIINDEE